MSRASIRGGGIDLKLKDYPSDRTLAYCRSVIGHLSEFSQEFDTVYVAPVGQHGEEAASVVWNYLRANVEGRGFSRPPHPNAVYAVFDVANRRLSAVSDRVPGGRSGLIAVGYEKDDAAIDALLTGNLNELNISEFLYTWIDPRAGYDAFDLYPEREQYEPRVPEQGSNE